MPRSEVCDTVCFLNIPPALLRISHVTSEMGLILGMFKFGFEFLVVEGS
jgi:hypothetical protein